MTYYFDICNIIVRSFLKFKVNSIFQNSYRKKTSLNIIAVTLLLCQKLSQPVAVIQDAQCCTDFDLLFTVIMH